MNKLIRKMSVGALLSILGCGAMEEPEAEVGADALPSYTQTRWPSAIIPVCWMNVPSGHASIRAMVRDHLREYEQQTRLRFTGFGACTAADAPAIRIDDSPVQGSSYIGPRGGTGATMHLDLNGLSSDPNWLRQSVLHEFGHALGLPHENKRPMSPCNVAGDSDAVPGATEFGPYDDESIMNYCGMDPHWGSVQTHLSPWDVAGLNRTYGAPGFFFRHDGQSFRLLDLHLCHITGTQQLAAFGGPGVFTTEESHGGTMPSAPDCAWPDGYYRAADQSKVFVAVGSTVCALESDDQLKVYGGATKVMILNTGTDPTRGRTNTGVCGWPGGFYQLPGNAVVRYPAKPMYRVVHQKYCRVKDGQQLVSLGGTGRVWPLGYRPAGLFTGRDYLGDCP